MQGDAPIGRCRLGRCLADIAEFAERICLRNRIQKLELSGALVRLARLNQPCVAGALTPLCKGGLK